MEDSAAVDGDGSIVVLYPPAGAVVFLEVLGTLAAVAVGQGEGFALGNGDDGRRMLSLDTVPVQAESNIIVARPCLGKRHILGQVVVACLVNVVQTGNARPSQAVAGVRPVRAGLAADGMRMRRISRF